MKYTKELKVLEFLTKNNELTVANLINYFLETSNEESFNNNISNKKLIEKGYTWMIHKWKIKVLKRPKAYEKINVSTWASGFKGLNAFREFEIKINEEIIAKASVIFILIDLENRKPIKIPEEIINYYSCEDEKNFEKIERINIKKDLEKINSYSYRVMKRDIDENNHMNNSIYLDLLKEAIPKGNSNNLKEIVIQYMKEIKYDENLNIDVYSIENNLLFEFTSPDKSIKYARASIMY